MSIIISTCYLGWSYPSGHLQCIFDDPGNLPAIGHHTGGYLDDLLVPSLNAAFPLPEMRNVFSAIADDLHFDMSEPVYCCFLCKDLLGGTLFDGSLYHR